MLYTALLYFNAQNVCVCPKWATEERMAVWVMSLCWLRLCWSKLQWQKTISGAAGLQSLSDLEDASSKTLPLPTGYLFQATTI